MKRKLLILALVGSISMTIYSGYQTGYSLGQLQGWNAGHNDAMAQYPQLSMDNVTFTVDGNTISMSNLTIHGEQHIIDTINNLPNMNNIIPTKRANEKIRS